MKKNLFIYLLTVLCAVNLFTACSDDDDAPKFPIDSELAGNYKGKLDVKITQEGQEIPGGSIDPQFISVSKAGETAVNLAISDFSFMGIKIGDIKIDNCQLYEHAGAYSFAGTTNVDTEALTAAVNATGAFSGNKLTISMDIEASLKVGDIKQTVKVTYEGTKLSGNEKGESQILSFTFDKKVAPVDSLVIGQPTINEENKTITFIVADTAKDEHLKNLVSTIEISEGATITPASGEKVDFSNGNVITYTVTAENGTKTEYKVSVLGLSTVYSFEEWGHSAGSFLANAYDYPMPKEVWASSAEGAGMLKLMGITEVPIFKSEDAKDGQYAVKLVSLDCSAKVSTLVPAITSGSLFTGKFKLDMENRLNSTKFGLPVTKEPIAFKGWYKYTPGAKFIDGSGATKPEEVEEIPGKTDECTIQAVLYEAKDAEGNEVILTGVDINNSEYRIAVAQLADGSAKAEYTEFNLPFEFLDGKTYDPNKEYKLAIILSSSKEGDYFKGAGGSTLIVDKLEIISK